MSRIVTSNLLGEIWLELVLLTGPPEQAELRRALRGAPASRDDDQERARQRQREVWQASTLDGAPLVGIGASEQEAVADLERQYLDPDYTLDVVFDGPRETSPRFVEIQRNGRAVAVGQWEPRGQRWVLRLRPSDFTVRPG